MCEKESVMSEDVKQDVPTDSAEFKRGGEAGLNSAEDTKNRKAGNELGHELKGAGETTKPAHEKPRHESATPLFLRGGPEGNKGNAQDEKDATGE
jgi:hypothetical protein